MPKIDSSATTGGVNTPFYAPSAQSASSSSGFGDPLLPLGRLEQALSVLRMMMDAKDEATDNFKKRFVLV
jgi:hypothetical protein